MALKIGKARNYTNRELYEARLWAMVDKDELLSAYFNTQHPLLEYRLIDCSDALNFWAGLKIDGYKTQQVCGSAFVHDFRGVYTDEQTEAGFKISFHNVIRNLLINVWHEDTFEARLGHKFFEDGELNPNRITDYVKLCTQNFKFARLQAVELGNAWRWFWSVDGCQDFGFHIAKNFSQTVMGSEFADSADRCTRDHVTNLIVRGFIATKSNAEMAKKASDAAKHGERTADLMAQVRRSVAAVALDKQQDIRTRQVASLANIKLPDGPTIKHSDIAGRLA